MTFRERMAAYLAQVWSLHPRRPQPFPVPEGAPPLVQEIQDAKALAVAGEMAESWLGHPFTQPFLTAIEGEIEAAHSRLLSGALSSKAYRELHALGQRLRLYADDTAKAGVDAQKRLTQWRKDGTLEEADAFVAAETSHDD